MLLCVNEQDFVCSYTDTCVQSLICGSTVVVYVDKHLQLHPTIRYSECELLLGRGSPCRCCSTARWNLQQTCGTYFYSNTRALQMVNLFHDGSVRGIAVEHVLLTALKMTTKTQRFSKEKAPAQTTRSYDLSCMSLVLNNPSRLY